MIFFFLLIGKLIYLGGTTATLAHFLDSPLYFAYMGSEGERNMPPVPLCWIHLCHLSQTPTQSAIQSMFSVQTQVKYSCVDISVTAMTEAIQHI